jgi:hypothetical protein
MVSHDNIWLENGVKAAMTPIKCSNLKQIADFHQLNTQSFHAKYFQMNGTPLL